MRKLEPVSQERLDEIKRQIGNQNQSPPRTIEQWKKDREFATRTRANYRAFRFVWSIIAIVITMGVMTLWQQCSGDHRIYRYRLIPAGE
jgi:hypothetical protein